MKKSVEYSYKLLSEKRINTIIQEFQTSKSFSYEDEIPNTYPIPFSSNWQKIESKSQSHNEIQKKLKNQKPKSLYVGIPYCNYRCTYCVYMINEKYNSDKIDNYLKLLSDELKVLTDLGLSFSNIRRIYIGGGTPSILNNNQLNNLFEIINSKVIDTNKIKSFTFELSPESINKSKIEYLKKNVNRISIGVQDIHPEVLNLVNRRTTSNIISRVLSILADNIEYYNVDLIYGLPNQTESHWINTVYTMLEYRVPEITLYNARVGRNSKLKQLSLTPTGEKLYLLKANSILEMNDYIQVRPFHWVRDNKIKKLWMSYKYAPFSDQHSKRNGHEIGIGASAVSHIGDIIFKNYDIAQIDKYSENINNHILPINKLYRLSGLDYNIRKLIYGVEEGRFIYEELDENTQQQLLKLKETLLKLNLVKLEKNHFKITDLGKIFYNNIEKEIVFFLHKSIAKVK